MLILITLKVLNSNLIHYNLLTLLHHNTPIIFIYILISAGQKRHHINNNRSFYSTIQKSQVTLIPLILNHRFSIWSPISNFVLWMKELHQLKWLLWMKPSQKVKLNQMLLTCLKEDNEWLEIHVKLFHVLNFSFVEIFEMKTKPLPWHQLLESN